MQIFETTTSKDLTQTLNQDCKNLNKNKVRFLLQNKKKRLHDKS